jgi:hypothetical protein
MQNFLIVTCSKYLDTIENLQRTSALPFELLHGLMEKERREPLRCCRAGNLAIAAYIWGG